MFELADRLIGIYKTYNCTKSVTINPKKIALPLGEIDVNTENDPNSANVNANLNMQMSLNAGNVDNTSNVNVDSSAVNQNDISAMNQANIANSKKT